MAKILNPSHLDSILKTVDPLIPSPYELNWPIYLLPKPLKMIPGGLEKGGYEGFFMRNVDQKWQTDLFGRYFAWNTLGKFFLVHRHHIKIILGSIWSGIYTHGVGTRGRTKIAHLNLDLKLYITPAFRIIVWAACQMTKISSWCHPQTVKRFYLIKSNHNSRDKVQITKKK